MEAYTTILPQLLHYLYLTVQIATYLVPVHEFITGELFKIYSIFKKNSQIVTYKFSHNTHTAHVSPIL